MFIFGLDFGQAADYTALAIVEPVAIKTGLWDTHGEKTRTELHVRHLERFPLRTSYPEIVEKVAQRVEAAFENKMPAVSRTTIPGSNAQVAVVGSSYVIVADATGVGRPVIDLLRRAGLQTAPLTITGGQKVKYERGYNVPKRDLITCVQVSLQEGRLKFADGLPEVSTLVKELLTMQVKITDDAHDTYGAWREGTHDDLALAVAMATWYARYTGNDR